MSLHTDALKNRWLSLSLSEQMGNIGSEVGRSITGRSKETARDRALELFDLTISDNRWAGARRKELARARESYLEALESNNLEDLSELNKYFYQFALLAR